MNTSLGSAVGQVKIKKKYDDREANEKEDLIQLSFYSFINILLLLPKSYSCMTGIIIYTNRL